VAKDTVRLDVSRESIADGQSGLAGWRAGGRGQHGAVERVAVAERLECEEQRDLGVRTRFKRTTARRHDEGTERCKATDPCGYPVQETHRHQASKAQHGPSTARSQSRATSTGLGCLASCTIETQRNSL
jgi:hypothetical protein